MSDSVRLHRRQPTRLPRLWDSPGKNTGVGCHFLLRCMKVKSEREVAQSYPTLSDPMECSLPGSFVHRIFQARILEWGAIAFSALQPLGSLKSLLQHRSLKASILLHSAFFMVQLSHLYMTTGKIIALTRWTSLGKVMPLLFNMLPATAKSLQSCPTLCDSIDGSPPGSPVPGILQARTLEWVAISFSNA